MPVTTRSKAKTAHKRTNQSSSGTTEQARSKLASLSKNDPFSLAAKLTGYSPTLPRPSKGYQGEHQHVTRSPQTPSLFSARPRTPSLFTPSTPFNNAPSTPKPRSYKPRAASLFGTAALIGPDSPVWEKVVNPLFVTVEARGYAKQLRVLQEQLFGGPGHEHFRRVAELLGPAIEALEGLDAESVEVWWPTLVEMEKVL